MNLTRQSPLRPDLYLLRDVNFALERGEVMAIVGPSGAGKSTLLRLLNRLDEPTAGQVFLNETDTRELQPRELRRRVGMVMQRPWLFPGTVAENIAYGPIQHGQSLAPEPIDAMLAEVGLEGYAARDAATLSGGEAQRVSILRALANVPEVLLLDEPTSALDAAARDSVEAALERVIASRRLTCVWVTHSVEQARKIADRALSLAAGRVAALGTPAEVFDRVPEKEPNHVQTDR
ncbi:MAG: ATP-binding cassette domain-containing protein [Acidobacteriota bacterium]